MSHVNVVCDGGGGAGEVVNLHNASFPRVTVLLSLAPDGVVLLTEAPHAAFCTVTGGVGGTASALNGACGSDARGECSVTIAGDMPHSDVNSFHFAIRDSPHWPRRTLQLIVRSEAVVVCGALLGGELGGEGVPCGGVSTVSSTLGARGT